ncbi:MAG TPA: ABC transporter permease [Bacteroidales bacterium]|nr:ABC transporter permease [Bacteroidales bacterium]
MNNMFQNNQLWQLTKCHLLETVREPGVLFWGIVFPILMSLGLGIAFMNKKDVTHNVAMVGIVAPALDSLLSAHGSAPANSTGGKVSLHLNNPKTGNTTFAFFPMSWEEAMVQLKRGQLNLIVTDSAGSIRYHFDPLNPDGQLAYLKLSNVVDNHALLDPKSHENISPLTVKGTRYIDFLIPGLIALGVLSSTMWGVSYTIIERRAKKLLRRMVATPMKKSNLLISMITVRVMMNFVESVLLLLFAWLVFGISIQGSIPALFAIFLAGNIACAGIAIFISSHTSKTEIGNGLINAVTMPMMVLSGIFFSYHNFPAWSLGVIKSLPLTMMADSIRAIFNEGAGWAQVSMPSLILTLTGTVFFIAGLRIFKWH